MPVGVSTHPISVYLELMLCVVMCVCKFKSDCHNPSYPLCMLVCIGMAAYAMIIYKCTYVHTSFVCCVYVYVFV